jgi:hypothetical protein
MNISGQREALPCQDKNEGKKAQNKHSVVLGQKAL